MSTSSEERPFSTSSPAPTPFPTTTTDTTPAPITTSTIPTRGRPLSTQSIRASLPTPSDIETYNPITDARGMSPRRNSEDIEKMGVEAREMLEEQARMLQANLLEIVERVESVKSEHEKLEGRNRFLQSYIGELMQTSKITSTTGADGKSKKGRKK